MRVISPAPPRSILLLNGGHTAVAQRLIERGADVNLTGRSGITPVAAAAYAGSDAIVEALLAHGADERAPDQTGKLPLIYAAAGGDSIS